MPHQRIISRFDGRTLYECEADSLLEALQKAVADGSDLSYSDLSYSNLSGSDLRYSDLSGSNLSGSKINWQSHDIIAELLRLEAGDDIQKRMVAGLILVSRDWCWNQFLAIEHEQRNWALETLAKCVTEGDGAPEELVRIAASLQK